MDTAKNNPLRFTHHIILADKTSFQMHSNWQVWSDDSLNK